MRRTARLFKIIQFLRRRRTAATARRLAELLEVSERTVYRDIAHLVDTGVPIRGEAGVGYLLERSFDLPPLMFDELEIEALALGARMVRAWSDPLLAAAADDALAKVEAVLPAGKRARLAGTPLFAFNFSERGTESAMLHTLRRAIASREKISFDYRDRAGAATGRTVRPLGLFYWGRTWTLGAWCELRVDFRSFRIDRMAAVQMLPERFPDEPGRTLADLFRHYDAEGR